MPASHRLGCRVAMELGCDAVLLNSAIAMAKDRSPWQAMKHAVQPAASPISPGGCPPDGCGPIQSIDRTDPS